MARLRRALTYSKEFGSRFGVKFTAPFKAGERVAGTIVPTSVDPAVAYMQKPYEGKAFDIVIDRIEPERLFSFHWHPGGVDPTIDYARSR